MLVIIKQMLTDGKETFKDFTESDEAIATNILSTKLKSLEQMGFITKVKLPHNKKTNLYLLTDKGLSLTPILVELAQWSDSNLRDVHPSIQQGPGMELLRKDKPAFIELLVQSYREKLNKVQQTISEGQTQVK